MDESLPHEDVLHLMKLRKRNNISEKKLIDAFESLFHEYWASFNVCSLIPSESLWWRATFEMQAPLTSSFGSPFTPPICP